MKGTTAELWTKMTKKLKIMKIMMIGASQKRLRTFKKSHNSFNNPILDIGISSIIELELLGIITILL
jgi:hypothetical protein